MSEIRASRITTISRVYLIIGLFIALIFCLVFLFQFQMNASVAVRTYVGAEGLWAKAQKDAIHSLEHYAVSHDKADYHSYLRHIQVPLGDQRARIELQKENPDIASVREGFIQGRFHPVDIEYAIPFFLRFQHTAYMSQVIGHWTAADRLIAEMNGVAEALHKEISSGRNNPEAIRTYLAKLDDINRQVTGEEDLFSSTLAESSRWANDVFRNLTYTIALLFVALGVALSWPITARIRATETALAESENRFRSIFEHVDDIIYTIKTDGTFSSISPSCERMLGWQPDEWIGRPFPLIIHPDDLSRIQNLFMQVLAGESLPVFQVRILTKGGGYLESEIVTNPIHSGDSISVLGVMRDITERNRATKAIEESERKFRSILDVAVDGVLLADGQTHKFISANRAICTMLGYEPEELYRLGVEDIHPAETLPEVYRQFEHQLKGEIRTALDLPVKRKDGSVFLADVSSAPMKLSGQSIMVGFFHDVTERKQMELKLQESERRFRNIAELTTDWVWQVDEHGIYVYSGAKVHDLLGYDAEEVCGKTPFDFMPPEEAARVSEIFKNIATKQIPFSFLENINLHKDGHRVILETSGVPLFSSDGIYQGYFGTERDITERKQAEDEIRQLNEKLDMKVKKRTQQLNEAQEELVRKEKLAVLGQVAGSVGHELRNPLGVMSNAVYFLQTVLPDADESVKEYLNIIKSEITGSERIVSDLLDSVRTKPPQPEAVGVAELIEQTLRKLDVPSFVTIKLEIPETLPPLWVDPQQIHQVFRNLISNGIEAMPEGGMLEIRALSDEAAKKITLTVRDSGIGMTPEHLGKLFQPLFTTKARGIGLGLVVVKNLTQANGGSVKVQSEAGKGTLFGVTLPSADEMKGVS